MTNLTDADLAAMKARADAATPGPWGPRHFGYVFARGTTPQAAEAGYDGTPIVDTFMWTEQGESNREFIAHAREDVPALLVEVAALRKQIDLADKAPHTPGCEITGLWVLPERGRFATQKSGKYTCWRAEYDAVKEALDHE